MTGNVSSWDCRARARELRIAKLLYGFVVPLLPQSLHSRQTCLQPSFLANQRYRKPRQEVPKLCFTDPHEPAQNRTIKRHKYLYETDGTTNQWIANPATALSKSADLRVLGVRLPLPAPIPLSFRKTYTFPAVSDLPALSLSYAAAIRRGISLRRTCATGFSWSRSSVACTRRSA
jgi:hypothetical protein